MRCALREWRLSILVGLLVGVLFVLAESALLSIEMMPFYGKDPRATFPGHVRP